MSQNLVQMVITQEQEDAIHAAIALIESHLPGLIALEAEERRSLRMLGPKSEAFVRNGLSLLEQNRSVVPPSLDLEGAVADMAARDRMLRIHANLQRLFSRVSDTLDALGSDAFDVAQTGYGMLKVLGKAHGLEDAVRELGYRFARSRRKPTSSAE